MYNRTTHNLILLLLCAAFTLTTSACASGTALYAGLAAASAAGSGALWYMSGEEIEALNAKQQYLQAALDTQTYPCDALKDTIAATMIEKGYSYSFESTQGLHLSDWDYFRPQYDSQYNKIHDGGRRRMLFEATTANEGRCRITAYKQTLMSGAPEARKERDIDLELGVLMRIDPKQFDILQNGAEAAYVQNKESE